MKSLPVLSAAALVLLAGCNSQPSKPEVVDTNPDPLANALANSPKIELPPSIKADKSLRCADHSVVYVTFFEGDKQAVVRTAKDGAPTTLKAETAGDPLVADGGWKLTGTPASVSLTQPGKDAQTCKS